MKKSDKMKIKQEKMKNKQDKFKLKEEMYKLREEIALKEEQHLIDETEAEILEEEAYIKTTGKKKKYIYTFGEEVANATTHGPMALLCLFALPFSAIWAYTHAIDKPITAAVGASIFVVSIFLMFLFSTLYHVMREYTTHKRVFQIFDHIFIYFAIAGTYTPIALYLIGGWQGIVIVCVQWAMVLFGIFYKSLAKRSIPKVSLTIYLIMGWTIIFFFPLFLANASLTFIILIGAGGVLYTLGSVFYAMKNFKYHHMIWHLLINLAAVCHYIAITFFIYH